ncbi:MAG: 50S ribosomal protein L33 [Candidatus Nealsonbacteria bacterium CG11_big_fil_rev_8_21_14_0_20_35_11]|uniref:Large ribosomal subunit protein bL33 n=1 Tax=Candidatus Nealsonbacteria bacterium CG11_big_fil_rev_8_21_14_0_20_35_11 TaxID=1974713 RepID=A0A2H0N0U9_9BACT|nr:MAG: 50S ribosomal protein L33 [Candidatus Nealsonbacteria bacterium CG11_big_fil_rev_8_21_14_0_20_35_11]
MAVKKKPFIKLQCQECKRINYFTHKSKQKTGEKKLGLKKFCRWCRKHTLHKEGKK